MLDRIKITFDPSFLQLVCWIVGALFLIAIVRIILLSRANRRMTVECARMEKQSVEQQIEITSVLHDAQSWRARFQRQFDAMRNELAHRLQQSEKSNTHAQHALSLAQQAALTAAMAKAEALESRLAAQLPNVPLPNGVSLSKVATPTNPSGPALPPLPTMEGLHLQAKESELAELKNQLSASKRENAEMHRALLLARRRQPATRRPPTRGRARPC